MRKYKDTHGKSRVGASLKNVAPDLITTIGDITGIEAIEKIGKAIKGDSKISVEDKETALALLDLDRKVLEEVSKRWNAVAISDSWLSKNVRPLVLMYLVFVCSLFCFLDSVSTGFTVLSTWVDLFSTILVVTIGAYFGSRGWEKAKSITKK